MPMWAKHTGTARGPNGHASTEMTIVWWPGSRYGAGESTAPAQPIARVVPGVWPVPTGILKTLPAGIVGKAGVPP